MKKLPLFFHCEDIKYRLTQKTELRDWLVKVLNDHKRTFRQIDFILCSDNYLRQINKRFLKHNDYTDIITFDYSDDENIQSDIFISIERVRENAATYGVSVTDELHRVLVHGVLHLVGRDKTATEKALMTEKEEYYLSLRHF